MNIVDIGKSYINVNFFRSQEELITEILKAHGCCDGESIIIYPDQIMEKTRGSISHITMPGDLLLFGQSLQDISIATFAISSHQNLLLVKGIVKIRPIANLANRCPTFLTYRLLENQTRETK